MLSTEDVVTSTQGVQYVTIETIEEIVALETDVKTPNGLFRIRALSFGEMLTMKDGISEGDEWEATKRMLSAALVAPKIETVEDAETLGNLAPTTVSDLVEAITKLSGLEVDDEEEGTVSFSEGSRTE